MICRCEGEFPASLENIADGEVVEEIIVNLFPEGIELGSTMISENLFRIPEGMRLASKTNLEGQYLF